MGVSASKDILTTRGTHEIRKPKSICRSDVNWDTYTSLVENDFPRYNDIINALSDTGSLENLDQAVSNLSKSLYRSAQSATVTKVLIRNEATITNPIYNIAAEMLSRFQNNYCTGQKLQVIRKKAIDNLLAETTYVQRSAWSTLLTERDSKAVG